MYTYMDVCSQQVANADVRTNATTLFLEVFPLQDHSQYKQDQEEALQRQFNIMKVHAHSII